MVPVKDIAATILALATAEHTGSNYGGREVATRSGQSALALLSSIKDFPHRIHVEELMGKRSVAQGNWNLIHMPPPYGAGTWQLYDLSSDLVETNDLTKTLPRKVAALIEIWNEYEHAHQLRLPD